MPMTTLWSSMVPFPWQLLILRRIALIYRSILEGKNQQTKDMPTLLFSNPDFYSYCDAVTLTALIYLHGIWYLTNQ